MPFSVEIDRDGPTKGVGVLMLEQGGSPVVVLNHELLRRLEATLAGLPKDLMGLVLASAAPRAFVAGADLKAIMELEDVQLRSYLAYASGVYAMLVRLPYPTAAAINSHALGGGLELAMHCDGLIGAPTPIVEGKPKAYQVGLPEAGLGICPGWGGTCLLTARIEPGEAVMRTASGKPMSSDEAIGAGLFDAVAPDAATLVATAKAWVVERGRGGRIERDGAPSRHAGRLDRAGAVVKAIDRVRGELPATLAGASVVRAVEMGVAQGWDACLRVEQEELVRLRNTPTARDAIAAFFAKSKK
jgi:enoyl-CoA hydratase/carnithine racemase